MRRLCFGLAVVLVAAASMAACGTSTAGVRIHITPTTSRVDQPLSIAISGLRPDQPVQVQLTSTDALATPWRSRADFEASRNGDLELDRARALSGSYSGVFGMGLIASMTPTRPIPPQDDAYYWGSKQAFLISVSANGHTMASRTFFRTGFPGLSLAAENLPQVGFVGRWITPGGHASPLAVLELGGSEGGIPALLYGSYLALHGYRTLQLAYFEASGLPSTLSDIPLEYFARALTWLHRQPGVKEVLVEGVSRGSEAALLLGVHYPTLVQGVIASVPSGVAVCSYPACGGPAWTLGGTPIPYTTQFNNPEPSDDPGAVIPVAQIHGPILLDCGGSDRVWVSCTYSRAIETELDAAHDPLPHPLYAYPDGGHGVGDLSPYEPPPFNTIPALQSLDGTTPVADAEAVADLWPHVLRFLAALATQ